MVADRSGVRGKQRGEQEIQVAEKLDSEEGGEFNSRKATESTRALIYRLRKKPGRREAGVLTPA
jgi:hypothetical protein